MNEDLRQWLRQKWVDISRKKKGGGHPPCGASADKGVRAKDSSKKYPKCVPANKAKSMSKKQKKSAVTRKRRAPNEPGSPDFVKTDVKKENWEKWKSKSGEIYGKGLPSNNAPENPEPMGGAVAFEKNRKEILALKEYINELITSVLYENTVAPRRRQKAAVATVSKIDFEGLKNILNKPRPDANEVNNVIDYLKARDSQTLSTDFKNLDEKQIQMLETIVGNNVDPISKIYPELYNKIEFARGQKHLSQLAVASSPPAPSATRTKKRTSENVSKTVELLKSQEVRKAIAEYIKKLEQAGIAGPEISKRIADLGDVVDPEYPSSVAASQIRGLDPRYLGPPQVSPEEKNIFQKVKSWFGLNETETNHLMETYNIRNEEDLHILMEAMISVILKEGK